MPIPTLKDLIDIVLVALVLYGIFRLLRRSGAVNLFWGLFVFVLTWFVVSFGFHLELTGALFDRFIEVGAFALIVIFQNEIRSFFYHIGVHMENISRRLRPQSRTEREQTIEKVVTACRHMSQSHTGALIVLAGEQDLREYSDTGERLNAVVSVRLIEHIFFKNTPLHDGALIVRDGRLSSAACVLPLSASRTLSSRYGLRHRAALGLSEKTDAIAVVVSEETGGIAVAHGENIEEIPLSRLNETLRQLWDGAPDIHHTQTNATNTKET